MMEYRETFDRLVAGISQEERRSLLSRLLGEAQAIERPVFTDQDLGEREDPGKRFKELPFLSRIFLYIRAFFSGLKPEEAFSASLSSRIGTRIEARVPGTIDLRHRNLLPRFREELLLLKRTADFFRAAIVSGVDRDRGAFYAYLASLELEEAHLRLTSETDPWKLAIANPGKDIPDMKRLVSQNLEEIFSFVIDDQKRGMSRHARSIACLSRFASFDFKPLLSDWLTGPGGVACLPVSHAADAVEALANVTYSLREPPSLPMMEAMLVFQLKAADPASEEPIAERLAASLSKAETALEGLRSVVKTLPLADLVRYASNDPDWSPQAVPGGEDWFALWKQWWKQAAEREFARWERDVKRDRLREEIYAFLGTNKLPDLPNVSKEASDERPPVRLEYALKFLSGFFAGPALPDIMRPLKLVLLDGEFYKKENRIEFTDAFSTLQKTPESVATLNRRLGHDGDLGLTWIDAKKDMTSYAQKKKHLQLAASNAELEADTIVRDTINALRTIVAVSNGILHGEVGGRYDSLANLSYIDGKNNAAFKYALDKTKDMLERMLIIVRNLSEVETAERARDLIEGFDD